MDVFKFKEYLRGLLKTNQNDEVIRVMYETTMTSLGHTGNVEKVAHAFIDTAHTLLFTASDRKGVEQFEEILGQQLRDLKRARADTDISRMTNKINND